MKLQIIIFITIGVFCSTYGQQYLVPLKKQDTLMVSDIKTTHLLFDKKIKYLDIGSPYFVADTLQQIIRLKHIGEELTDVRSQVSNLTVITEDGGYYSIILGYNRFANPLTYKVKKSEYIVDRVTEELQKVEEKSSALVSLCDQLERHSNTTLHIKSGNSGDLKVKVSGIFYIKEKIGIRIELKNESTIDFDIDHILFRTKLHKRFSKDYLYQERVINPIYTCTNNFEVIGHGRQSITLLFDKFMLNEKEKLAIDIFEENGGRSVTVDILRKTLLQPKVI